MSYQRAPEGDNAADCSKSGVFTHGTDTRGGSGA